MLQKRIKGILSPFPVCGIVQETDLGCQKINVGRAPRKKGLEYQTRFIKLDPGKS